MAAKHMQKKKENKTSVVHLYESEPPTDML